MSPSPPARMSGSVIAQFETAEGERTGPQLDIPVDTTPSQLQLIINELLSNEEKVPYSFYIAEEEIASSLEKALGSASTEQVVRVVYVPQAIFRVRAVTRCSSTLPGHAEALLSSSFSPDGNVLATGSGDHTVRLWDVHTETPRATLKAHKDWVLCISWSPCGRFLASGGKDGNVILWKAMEKSEKGDVAPLRVMNAHKKWVNAIAWEPLHLSLAMPRFASAGKDGQIRIWEVFPSFLELWALPDHCQITFLLLTRSITLYQPRCCLSCRHLQAAA